VELTQCKASKEYSLCPHAAGRQCFYTGSYALHETVLNATLITCITENVIWSAFFPCYHRSELNVFALNLLYHRNTLLVSCAFFCGIICVLTASKPDSYDVVIENNDLDKAYNELKATVLKVMSNYY